MLRRIEKKFSWSSCFVFWVSCGPSFMMKDSVLYKSSIFHAYTKKCCMSNEKIRQFWLAWYSLLSILVAQNTIFQPCAGTLHLAHWNMCPKWHISRNVFIPTHFSEWSEICHFAVIFWCAKCKLLVHCHKIQLWNINWRT